MDINNWFKNFKYNLDLFGQTPRRATPAQRSTGAVIIKLNLDSDLNNFL
jgi:hypothetical protein